MLSNALVIVLVVTSLVCLGASLFALFSMGRNYVPRREFELMRADIRTFEVKIESLFQRTFDKIEERDSVTSDKIENVAKAAYSGRRDIHERVNDLRERVARSEQSSGKSVPPHPEAHPSP